MLNTAFMIMKFRVRVRVRVNDIWVVFFKLPCNYSTGSKVPVFWLSSWEWGLASPHSTDFWLFSTMYHRIAYVYCLKSQPMTSLGHKLNLKTSFLRLNYSRISPCPGYGNLIFLYRNLDLAYFVINSTI